MSISTPTHYTEQAHVFGDGRLVGVMSLPNRPARTAVIVIVGGPQYRAGSHRQFVLLCRALAAQGIACFRFDYTGMGDSPGDLSTFLSANRDIACAVDFFSQQQPNIQRMALWGLCDGASAALLYWHQTRDPRIHGLGLLNPWVRSATSQAQTQIKHYYIQRLMQPAFWRKLFSGQVALGALSELTQSFRTMLAGQRHSQGASQTAQDLPFQDRMGQAWRQYPGQLLLVLSGADYTAKEFLETSRSAPSWRGALEQASVQRHDLPMADHTFSDPHLRIEVEAITAAWLARL